MSNRKSHKRRKPILNEERVKVIASTFEREMAGLDYKVISVSYSQSEPGEWSVLVMPKEFRGDGFDNCIMVNDRTGKARYRHEYLAELRAGSQEEPVSTGSVPQQSA
jgi:hypothetical protein